MTNERSFIEKLRSFGRFYVVPVTEETELALDIWLRQHGYRFSIPILPGETLEQAMKRQPGDPVPNPVATLRLLAKCGSMDLSALGPIADEMERLGAALLRIRTEWRYGADKDALYQIAIDALNGASAEPSEQPVAWLKEWTSVGGAQIHRRVDLTDSCEQWLMNMFLKITPLYARPAEKSGVVLPVGRDIKPGNPKAGERCGHCGGEWLPSPDGQGVWHNCHT